MLIVVWLQYKTFIKNLFWFMIQIIRCFIWLHFTMYDIISEKLKNFLLIFPSTKTILFSIINYCKLQFVFWQIWSEIIWQDHWHNIAHHVLVLYIIIIYLTEEVFLFTDDNNNRFPTSSLLGLLNSYSNILVLVSTF